MTDNDSTVPIRAASTMPSATTSPAPSTVTPSIASTVASSGLPKRKLPKHLIPHVQPGAEYSPWGDAMWELCGSEPDGTLRFTIDAEKKASENREYWHKSMFHQLLIFVQINRITGFAEAPMPHRQPFPDWKWPLTHNERIAELEEILRDDHHEPSWENIRAAIEFHRKFDGEALCDAHPQVRFQNGQQLKDGEWPTLQSGQWQLNYWVEVILKAPNSLIDAKDISGSYSSAYA